MDIDSFRRKLIEKGLSSKEAGTAAGVMAEYAQIAYMNGYRNGYRDSDSEKIKEEHKQWSDKIRFKGQAFSQLK